MKSTTFKAPTLPANALLATQTNQDKWRAVPFLLLMFSSGLPLTYQLQVARPLTVADTAEFAMAATSSQNTANSIAFVLFICGLYLFAGWTVIRKPKVVVALLTHQWPIFLLLLLIAASAVWSSVPEKVLINLVHNTGITLIAIAAALRYRNNPWLFPKHVGYVVGANIVLHLLAIALIPTYAIDWQGRWQGLAPHPNTLGALAFVVLWSNASVLLFQKSDKFHLHFIFSALAMLAMFGANSMTTMACSAFSLLVMFVFYKTKNMRVQQRFSFYMIGICLLIPVVAAFLSQMISLDMLLNAFGRDSKLTGRVSLWEEAMKAISIHPFLGWSFDDHVHLLRVSNMPFQNFHNGILDLAVSGGFVAVLLFLLVLMVAALDYARKSKIGSSIIPFSASFMLTYLAFSFTEANLVSPRSQLWEMFLALAFLGTCKGAAISSLMYQKSTQKIGITRKPSLFASALSSKA